MAILICYFTHKSNLEITTSSAIGAPQLCLGQVRTTKNCNCLPANSPNLCHVFPKRPSPGIHLSPYLHLIAQPF